MKRYESYEAITEFSDGAFIRFSDHQLAVRELLDAAKAISNSTDYAADLPLMRILRAAIAKAEGRER